MRFGGKSISTRPCGELEGYNLWVVTLRMRATNENGCPTRRGFGRVAHPLTLA